MSDDDGITRRHVLGGMITIGAASAAAGAGTMALFSDTESSTGNSVSAGTLDLAIDGGDSATTTLSVTNARPGEGGSASSTIQNTGSIDGVVDVALGAASNSEGQNPSSETDTTEPGDLGSVLELTVSLDDDGDTSTTGDRTVVASGTVNGIDDAEYDVDHSLASGASSNLVFEWTLPSSATNAVQGDEVTLDVEVELGQEASQ